MPIKKHSKIFIDAYLLNKEPQGTQTYVRELYKEAAIQNPELTFYFGIFYDKKIIQHFSEFKNIKFLFFKNKSRLIRMIYEIPNLIEKNKFDFAHFQYVIPFFRNKHCKYIVTIHDILFRDFKSYFSLLYRLRRSYLFKYSALNADFLLTVSEYSKNRIFKQYKIDKNKIIITPNGVNSRFFEKYDKFDAVEYIYKKYGVKKFMLYVSRIEPRKNQDFLLKTFIQSKLEKEYQLVFIGENSIFNKNLKKIVDTLSTKQKERVLFFEHISTEDLLNFYRASDVFIFPSKAEGFGIPPIEAGALKIPVLCSNTTAMAEFDFFEPFFINPENKSLFSDKLKEIIMFKNDNHLDEIQGLIRANYTWKAAAKELSQIINLRKV